MLLMLLHAILTASNANIFKTQVSNSEIILYSLSHLCYTLHGRYIFVLGLIADTAGWPQQQALLGVGHRRSNAPRPRCPMLAVLSVQVRRKTNVKGHKKSKEMKRDESNTPAS